MRYSYLKTSKFTKKCMASGRRVGQRPDCHTFLCNFDIFKWLYLAYVWIYLNQSWGFCKASSTLNDYVDQ